MAAKPQRNETGTSASAGSELFLGNNLHFGSLFPAVATRCICTTSSRGRPQSITARDWPHPLRLPAKSALAPFG